MAGGTELNAPVDADSPTTRPRIEGDREQEIYVATLSVLAEMGYDNMTLDAVATAAHASKATLYRRWNGKLALVIDALRSIKATSVVPDTGNLREDLLLSYCSPGGVTDRASVDTYPGSRFTRSELRVKRYQLRARTVLRIFLRQESAEDSRLRGCRSSSCVRWSWAWGSQPRDA